MTPEGVVAATENNAEPPAGPVTDTGWRLIQGVAFTSHQLGSALGAFGGGWLFDAFGNYTLAWQIGVGMGLAMGTVQLISGLGRRPPPPAVPAPAG